MAAPGHQHLALADADDEHVPEPASDKDADPHADLVEPSPGKCGPKGHCSKYREPVLEASRNIESVGTIQFRLPYVAYDFELLL
jgi:hypothetical protein